jgi:hypothetical protein
MTASDKPDFPIVTSLITGLSSKTTRFLYEVCEKTLSAEGKTANRLRCKLGGKYVDFDSYQKAAGETALYRDAYRVTYPALGLASEAGEVAAR